MSYITDEPSNKNFLSPLGFKFSIKKTPHVNYFVQNVNLPGVSLGSASIPTPFVKVPLAGDHIGYGDLQITFKVDEDMANYLEIFNWIKTIGFPDSYSQYNPAEVYSDATLTVLSSAMNPKFDITFVDLYPMDLGGFMFNSTAADVDYIETVATFRFRTFNITPLT
jgi:hypothetical protein